MPRIPHGLEWIVFTGAKEPCRTLTGEWLPSGVTAPGHAARMPQSSLKSLPPLKSPHRPVWTQSISGHPSSRKHEKCPFRLEGETCLRLALRTAALRCHIAQVGRQSAWYEATDLKNGTAGAECRNLAPLQRVQGPTVSLSSLAPHPTHVALITVICVLGQIQPPWVWPK